MFGSNKYNVEVAIDAYHAVNGEVDKIDIDDNFMEGVEYGLEEFSDKEAVVKWLKEQFSQIDHQGIREFIKKNRNSEGGELQNLFDKYEKLFTKQHTEHKNIINNTQKQIDTVTVPNEKPTKKVEKTTTPPKKPETVKTNEKLKTKTITIENITATGSTRTKHEVVVKAPAETKPKQQKQNTKETNKQPVVQEKTKEQIELEKIKKYSTEELRKVGKTITELQEKLHEKGLYKKKIDGKFGNGTLEAIKAFQKTITDSKYSANGYVGPETISHLFGIQKQNNTTAKNHTDTY